MARKWWTLLAACLATFMVVDAYALGLATLLLASGSLADLLGRRLVFVTGAAVLAFVGGALAFALVRSRDLVANQMVAA